MATLAEQFKSSLTSFTTSGTFKESLKKLNLVNIKFEILTYKHAKSAIDILSKQFSIAGAGHRAQLFNCKSSNLYPYFAIVIKHAIKTGFSCVAIHNNQIIYVQISFDLFDSYSITDLSFNNLSPNIQATLKYFGFMESQIQTLKELKQRCSYDQVNCLAFGAISPSFNQSKTLATMMTSMHWVILSDIKSIKYCTHSYSHPKSAYYALNKFPIIFMDIQGLQYKIIRDCKYGQMMERFMNENDNRIHMKYVNTQYLQKLNEENIGWLWGLTSYDREKLHESMEQIRMRVVRKLVPSVFAKL